MKETTIKYCFMNYDGEFIGDDYNLVDNMEEAIGWDTLEHAQKDLNELDEPEEFMIVIIEKTLSLKKILKREENNNEWII